MKTMYYRELMEELPVKLTSCRDREVKEHKHTFLELVYVCDGKAEHIFGHQSAIVQKGDLFLIDLNCSHEYRRIGDGDCFRIINCLFLPRFLDEGLSLDADFRALTESPVLRIADAPISASLTQRIFHEDSDTIGALMERMLREFEEKKAGYVSVIRHLLSVVLIHLLRNEAASAERAPAAMLREVRAYVEEHLASPIQLSAIAERLNFSLPYVSAVFRRECGITFREYLIRTRIERACLLLRSTNENVAQIAEQVGYTDPAFFYKSFRREMDMTPDDYRRRYSAR